MTPEEHADHICKWTNASLRDLVVHEIEDAIAEEREATLQRVIEYCRKENRYLPLGLQNAIRAQP